MSSKSALEMEVSMFKVAEIVTRQSGIGKELHKIEMINGFDLKIFSQDMSHSYWAFRGLFRHATPEEIAAGHRIDLEDLRDCDTSPNCKKFDERVK
jgi:hypothetical protein